MSAKKRSDEQSSRWITTQLRHNWRNGRHRRTRAENQKLKKRKGKILVGTGRFELPTPRTPSECSTRLSHVPTWKDSAADQSSAEGFLKILHQLRIASPTPLDRKLRVCQRGSNGVLARKLDRDQSRSLQFAPTPISTNSGTASGCAFSIYSRTSDFIKSISSSGTSNTSSSCTCNVIRDFNPRFRRAVSIPIIAT